MGHRPAALFLVCVLSAGLPSAPAAAQAPTDATPSGDTDVSATDGDASIRLFREGRVLLNKGRFSEACDRFEASLALRRSPGTLLNVGSCMQSKGDLIGARKAFEETAELARAVPDARKAEVWSAAAAEEIAALDPRIPHLVVNVPAEPDVALVIDGEPLGSSGEPHALNPGPHRLVARAPGKLDFERELTLSEGQSLSIDIPALEPVAEAAPAIVSPPTVVAAGPEAVRAEPRSPSRVVPWTLVGVGGAALVGGIVAGVVATNRTADLENACPNHVCEDDLSQRDDAHAAAVLADVLMGAGLAATAAGVTWLVITAGDDAVDTSISAACDLGGCGASVRGRF